MSFYVLEVLTDRVDDQILQMCDNFILVVGEECQISDYLRSQLTYVSVMESIREGGRYFTRVSNELERGIVLGALHRIPNVCIVTNRPEVIRRYLPYCNTSSFSEFQRSEMRVPSISQAPRVPVEPVVNNQLNHPPPLLGFPQNGIPASRVFEDCKESQIAIYPEESKLPVEEHGSVRVNWEGPPANPFSQFIIDNRETVVKEVYHIVLARITELILKRGDQRATKLKSVKAQLGNYIKGILQSKKKPSDDQQVDYFVEIMLRDLENNGIIVIKGNQVEYRDDVINRIFGFPREVKFVSTYLRREGQTCGENLAPNMSGPPMEFPDINQPPQFRVFQLVLRKITDYIGSSDIKVLGDLAQSVDQFMKQEIKSLDSQDAKQIEPKNRREIIVEVIKYLFQQGIISTRAQVNVNQAADNFEINWDVEILTHPLIVNPNP